MKIEYLGHSCFAITSKGGMTVITDPYCGVGYELPQGLCADIVTVSHGHFDHAYIQAISTKMVVSTMQAYQTEWVNIIGVESFHDERQGALRGKNIIFKIEMDGLTICHMGDIGEEVSSALIEKIGKVDILLIPVGGTYTVDALGAKKYIEALQPKAVIPMHYRPTDGSLDITDCIPFLNLYGQNNVIHCGNEIEITENTHGILYMERALHE